MIIACPIEGLCNRLRMLDSCIALAADTDQHLAVFWKRDKDCNCDFRRLFLPHPQIHWILCPNPKTLSGKFIEAVIKRAVRHGPFERWTDEMLRKQTGSLAKRAANRSVAILSCEAFYPAKINLGPAASPVPEIADAVEAKGIIRQEYVGVHIRRTDHRRAIRFSPLEAFVRQMEEEIREDSRTQFYVASDEEDVRQQLLKIFPDRVKFSRIRTFSRNSPEGIRDAVIDLYSLGRCRKILGSYWSSFSQRAAQIGHCPLVVIHQDDTVAA